MARDHHQESGHPPIENRTLPISRNPGVEVNLSPWINRISLPSASTRVIGLAAGLDSALEIVMCLHKRPPTIHSFNCKSILLNSCEDGAAVALSRQAELHRRWQFYGYKGVNLIASVLDSGLAFENGRFLQLNAQEVCENSLSGKKGYFLTLMEINTNK